MAALAEVLFGPFSSGNSPGDALGWKSCLVQGLLGERLALLWGKRAFGGGHSPVLYLSPVYTVFISVETALQEARNPAPQLLDPEADRSTLDCPGDECPAGR